MRDFAALPASGLDIELRCPRCGPQSRLVDMANEAGESRCTVCAGSHIATKGMRKIFVDVGGLNWRAIETISGNSKPGATRCPSCHSHTAAISVGYTNADVCARCISAWFQPGTLFAVSGGKYGARTSASAEMRMPSSLAARKGHAPQRGREVQPPPQRSSAKGVLVVMLPLLALGSAGSVYWWLANGGVLPFIELLEEKKPVEAPKEAVSLVPEAPTDGLPDYPFGGRSAAAWGKRLTVLKARSDERGRALYELTKQRALLNGLSVDDSGAEVAVKPSPDLIARIGTRLGSTPMHDTLPIDPPARDKGSENRAQVVHVSKKHPRIILAKRDTATATLRIQFRAGAYDDAHRSGLTKLTQHAMLAANGAGDYQELMLDIFAANATLRLETGVRESAFTLTAPASEFEELAKRLATMCLAPKIAITGFDDAKSHALASGQESDLGALVSAIARTVFSEPGYQNDPDGDKESMRGLSLTEVQRHVSGPMAPANATVVVSGKFEAKKFKSFLSKFSGGSARPAARPKGELAGNYHLKSPIEVHLVAFPVSLRSPRSVAAAHLASALLQERIFHQFRKLGVAYAVVAAPVHREWLDSVVLMLPLDGDEPLPVADHLNDEIVKLKNGGIDEETFERNRRHLLADFAELDRDPERLAIELGVGGGELEWIGPKVIEQVEKMTRSELVDELGDQLSPRASIHVHFSPKSGAAAEKSAHR